MVRRNTIITDKMTFIDIDGLSKLEAKKADFWNGIHSKYPVCCVLFYCNGWDEIHATNGKFIDGQWGIKDSGYIECPECIIKTIL